MRELKFRVWDKHHKQYHYWGYIKGEFKGIPTNNTGMTIDYVKENTEQFTGKVIGKTELYENDIIDFRYRTWNNDFIELRGVLKYNADDLQYEIDVINGGIYFCLRRWSDIADVKIIGNIHENPELLEVTDAKFTLPKTN